MKPVKTLLFLSCTLVVVLAVYFYWYIPDPSVSLSNRDLQQTVSRSPKNRTEKPASVIAKEEKDEHTPSLSEQWNKDSLMIFYKHLYRLDADIFEDGEVREMPLVPFEYDTAGAGWFLLQDFFARLLALRNPKEADKIAFLYEKPDFWSEDLVPRRKNFLRVLYYGGSLIENDYVTGTLRTLMQEDFGGTGIGLLPLYQPNANFIQLKKSGKWRIATPQKDVPRGNFGVHTSCLTPPSINAFGQKTNDKGYIHINIPEKHQGKPLFLECFLHDEIQGRQLQIKADNNKLNASQVSEIPGQQRLTYTLPAKTKTVDLELRLYKNAFLYALSLNDTLGVCVDNLSAGNNAGDVFSHNNRRFLINQLNLLNTGLIIYQFDGSAALGKNKDYDYYRMSLMKELSYIRMLMPQTPVVVVGTASFGNIELLLDIQRSCALACGCAFWNLEDALGGDHAMARLAEAQPALVSRNLSHFTPRGADQVAKLFYRAFLYDYRRFLIQERKNMMLQRVKQLLPESQNR